MVLTGHLSTGGIWVVWGQCVPVFYTERGDWGWAKDWHHVRVQVFWWYQPVWVNVGLNQNCRRSWWFLWWEWRNLVNGPWHVDVFIPVMNLNSPGHKGENWGKQRGEGGANDGVVVEQTVWAGEEDRLFYKVSVLVWKNERKELHWSVVKELEVLPLCLRCVQLSNEWQEHLAREKLAQKVFLKVLDTSCEAR